MIEINKSKVYEEANKALDKLYQECYANGTLMDIYTPARAVWIDSEFQKLNSKSYGRRPIDEFDNRGYRQADGSMLYKDREGNIVLKDKKGNVVDETGKIITKTQHILFKDLL